MTDEMFKGKWHQIKGKVQEQWGELTDDDVDKMNGKSEQLIGKLQEKYGYTKAQAQQQVAEFMNKFESDTASGS
jgi:uncharacterized protein YjbJ (UPF0337 family)